MAGENSASSEEYDAIECKRKRKRKNQCGSLTQLRRSVRVNRITRIHNRFLRHRFESTVREILNKDNNGKDEKIKDKDKDNSSTSGKVPKRMLEYLFYGTPPSLTEQTGQNDEIIRVAEDGFRVPEEVRSIGVLSM